jgi:hypothetical protein
MISGQELSILILAGMGIVGVSYVLGVFIKWLGRY